MKSIDIFYKSYSRDFSLLYYSLQSLLKNVTGVNTVQIVIPKKDIKLFMDMFWNTSQKIAEIQWSTNIEYGNGYLYQQWCKLNAYDYCKADYILFADSDCIFDHPIDLQDYIKDDKPEILYTDYNKVGDAICWKTCTENFLGEPVSYEFMRRNCLIYHRSTLKNIAKFRPNLEKYIMESERFSEFNAIGAYINKYERDKYFLVNTDNWEYTPPKAEQLWGWAEKDNPDETHVREYARSLKVISKTLGLNIVER
jgi:hypothetical protein